MYAVIETGGKQYRVELGSVLQVERLSAEPGETISFERVLLVADGDSAQVGMPLVADATVTASIVRQERGDKVVVFKYRPKARHRAKQGHRQELTLVRVADIRFNGRSAADEAAAAEKDTKRERETAAAEAKRKAAADKALADKLAAETAEQEAEAPAPTKGRKSSKTAKAEAKAEAESAEAKPAAKAKAETADKKPAARKRTTKATTEEAKAPAKRARSSKKDE